MAEQDSDQAPDSSSVVGSNEPNSERPTGENASSVGSAEPPSSTADEAEPHADHASEDTEDGDVPDDTKTVDTLHFEDDDLGEKLRHASDEQLDNAPFGVIQVDDEGTIEFFNQYESELSGMDPKEVVGRNFFTDVAPCTNNRLFRGRFKKGVRRGELEETFSYTYTYQMRPTLVDIFLYRDEAGNNWITVQKY